MSQQRFEDGKDWSGRALIDRDGQKLGTIADVYLEVPGGPPRWILIHTGFFGVRETLVPASQPRRAGAAVRVPYRKAFVEAGLTVDLTIGLSPEQRAQLSNYYGAARDRVPPGPVTSRGEVISIRTLPREKPDDPSRPDA